MGARPPWGEIPDTNIVPAGAYEIAVKELADTMSKESDTERAKLMYVAQLKIQSPKEYKGLMITDRFTIGTNDDPEGQELVLLSFIFVELHFLRRVPRRPALHDR